MKVVIEIEDTPQGILITSEPSQDTLAREVAKADSEDLTGAVGYAMVAWHAMLEASAEGVEDMTVEGRQH